MDNKDAPWMTKHCKTAILRNKRVIKKWIKNGRKINEKYYVNKIQNATNKFIRETKKAYINNLASKLCDPSCGSKTFWRCHNKLLNSKKETNLPPILLNGELITNLNQKAEIFNTFLLNNVLF